MAYYSPTGAPVQQTRGTSPSIRNEFALIAAGFAQLPVPAAIAGGYSNYAGLDTGAANAYVVSLQPTIILAYTDGMVIRFKAANANSGASTINLNALGVKSLLQPDGSPLVTGLISANAIVEATYNSTYNGFLVGSNLYAYAASAAASAAAAAVSSAAAAASFTSFDTRYLGAKSSDPTLNNQGGALIDGALYWNTPAAQMRAYSLATTTWTAAYLPAAAYVLKAGDTLLGPLDEAQGASVASATTTDLSKATVTGNFLHLTGTANITAFTLAAGAERTVVVDSTPTITPGANLLVPGGAAISCAAGDRFIVRGETGGKSNIVAYTKADGTALVGGGTLAFGSAGTPTVLKTANGQRRTAKLSATLALEVYLNGSNNLFAKAVGNASGVLSYGTELQITTGLSVSYFGLKRLTATTALLAFYDSTNSQIGVTVLSVSGSTTSSSTVSNTGSSVPALGQEAVDIAVASATAATVYWSTGFGVFSSAVTISAGVPTAGSPATDVAVAATFLRAARHVTAAKDLLGYIDTAGALGLSVGGAIIQFATGFGRPNGCFALVETAAGGVNFFYSSVTYTAAGSGQAAVPFAVMADLDVVSSSKPRLGALCPLPGIIGTINRYPSITQLPNGKFIAAGGNSFLQVIAIEQLGKTFRVVGATSLTPETGSGSISIVAFDGTTALVTYADSNNSSFTTDVGLNLGAVGA